MIVIVPASEATADDAATPAHPAGRKWQYAAVALDGTTYYADSVTEIIDATLDGYAELKHVDENGETEFFDQGNDLALVMRYDDLVGYATGLQEQIVKTHIEEREFDPASISEEVLTALFAEKIVPFEGIPVSDDPANTDMDLAWSLEVPLVLLTSDYLPFTDRMVPDGNIVWLDPTTELTYLRSLDKIGVMKLLVAE
jgi:hypothetical protein